MSSPTQSIPSGQQSLTATVLRGGVWVVGGNIVTRIAGILRIMILGRLLQPIDLGVVALASTVFLWLEQLGQTGLQTTLIRTPGDIRPHLCTAWTINLTRSVIATVTMVLTADWLAAFVDTPQLAPLLKFAACGFVIKALESPGYVYVKREMNFSGEVRLLAGSTLAGLALMIPLAWWLRSAWAVIIATVFTQAVQTAFSYYLQPFRPRLEYKRDLAKQMFGFSRWIMWNSIAMFPIRNLTGILVGKVAGVRALGFYQVASQLAFLPTSQIGIALRGLLFPAFVKMEGTERIRYNFLRVITLLGSVVLPGACFATLFTHLILRVAMGEKWLASAPITQLLVWGGAATAISEINVQIITRNGYPKYVALINITRAIVLLCACYPVMKTWGAVGMAGLLMILAVSGMAVQIGMIGRMLQITARQFITSQRIGILASLPVLVAALAIAPYNLTYPAQGAVAAATAAACGLILLAFRRILRDLVSPRTPASTKLK